MTPISTAKACLDSLCKGEHPRLWRVRESRVSHVTLELMKQALLPEAYKSAVTIMMIQQDGATIVRKAEEGLMLTAQLMDEHLDMQDHDTGQ